MAIPTHPAAYWNPDKDLSSVYYLRKNGEWFHSPYGVIIPESKLPEGLVLLGEYGV